MYFYRYRISRVRYEAENELKKVIAKKFFEFIIVSSDYIIPPELIFSKTDPLLRFMRLLKNNKSLSEVIAEFDINGNHLPKHSELREFNPDHSIDFEDFSPVQEGDDDANENTNNWWDMINTFDLNDTNLNAVSDNQSQSIFTGIDKSIGVFQNTTRNYYDGSQELDADKWGEVCLKNCGSYTNLGHLLNLLWSKSKRRCRRLHTPSPSESWPGYQVLFYCLHEGDYVLIRPEDHPIDWFLEHLFGIEVRAFSFYTIWENKPIQVNSFPVGSVPVYVRITDFNPEFVGSIPKSEIGDPIDFGISMHNLWLGYTTPGEYPSNSTWPGYEYAFIFQGGNVIVEPKQSASWDPSFLQSFQHKVQRILLYKSAYDFPEIENVGRFPV